MRIKKIQLIKFKRFTDLTIDLGESPHKIIALVGPNGCGKSSVFDAFEDKSRDYRSGNRQPEYLNKIFSEENGIANTYNANEQIKIETTPAGQVFQKNSFYIRSSYRFTARIDIAQIRKLPSVEEDGNRPQTTIDLDSRMQENYERLIGGFYDEVYDKEKTGKQWAEENMTHLNDILQNVLDIKVSSLGNPVDGKGKLYFDKGVSKHFPYELLSSGEKEVVDIVLDLIIKTKTYNDTIFCIDEPELHLNTAIQRKLLVEIEKLIPDNSQLWIATHSIGFLRALQQELKDKTQIINMNDHDFDKDITLYPINKTRQDWQNIFQTALEDITGLVAPKTIIYCEGKMTNSLDEKIFNMIFSEIDDCLFVSATNKSESIKYAGVALTILSKAFDEVKIRNLIDRDDDVSLPKSSTVKICKLERREFENYLYDFEIVNKTFSNITEEMYNTIIKDIKNDDVKSKASKFIRKTGKTISEKDFKVRLSENITSDTDVYKKLHKIIFE
jgi:predicted ATPase